VSGTGRKTMIDEDIRKVIGWFNDHIAMLEQIPYREGTREGINRLRGFVEVLEGEMTK
jgi:hypothetical protein